jgi:dihydrofolate synthase/folylpolyglutamate synthase
MLQTMLQNVAYQPVAFICVSPDNPRALSASDLAEAVRRTAAFEQLPSQDRSRYNGSDAVMTANSPAEGARLALDLALDRGMALCAFGSLYMVGGIRSILAAGRR